MSLLSGLKSLFTAAPSAPAKEEDPIVHNGFIIIPAPINEGGQHRVAATITKGEGEDQKVHKFIRSDLIGSRDECITITIKKAKMTIDQLGDRLFN